MGLSTTTKWSCNSSGSIYPCCEGTSQEFSLASVNFEKTRHYQGLSFMVQMFYLYPLTLIYVPYTFVFGIPAKALCPKNR